MVIPITPWRVPKMLMSLYSRVGISPTMLTFTRNCLRRLFVCISVYYKFTWTKCWVEGNKRNSPFLHTRSAKSWINLPKENQDGGNEWLKVDMSIVVRVRIEHNVPEYLHPNDGVNEEQHPDQEDNVGQSLSHEQRYQCKIEKDYWMQPIPFQKVSLTLNDCTNVQSRILIV